jgi:ketosteroid isomerase-like protein
MSQIPSNGPRTIAARHVESLGNTIDCRNLLRDDAVLIFMDTNEIFYGPEEICAVFDNLHTNLFSASSRVRAFLHTDHLIAVEAEFQGTHVREFAGLKPTGRSVTACYALAYEIADGGIAAIRAYWNLDALVRQLRGG